MITNNELGRMLNLAAVEVNGKGKVVPLLNQAPPREDVLGEWRYSSTHS